MSPEFCTLFDVEYLTRGLVLYRSLEAVCDDFRLRVFCMDDRSKEILERLSLPKLVAVGLEELEAADPELEAVKPTRTQIEYCWTATPAVCLAALEREPELDAITYLDADLAFFDDPSELFHEAGDASIVITPHRFAPRWKALEDRGIYNVQFLTFRRDEDGIAALRWWRERCLEWCYARVEDGKMGDQGYLNDWPERFRSVHVLEHPGGGLAPWNVEAHRLTSSGGRVEVDGRPLVFFHYHGLRLHRGLGVRWLGRLPNRFRVSPSAVWTTRYPVGQAERELIWEPYLDRLALGSADAEGAGAPAAAGVVGTSPTIVLEETARRLLPASAARRLGIWRRALRRWVARGVHRDSWKSDSVVTQHRELVLRQLDEPDAVPEFRIFLSAVEALAANGALPRPARFLDVGCGLGHYGELLARRFPGQFDYLGCDYAPQMVEAARREWPERAFVLDDLLDTRLDLDSFDVICAGALIDVLEEYERGLDALLGTEAYYVLLHRQRITASRSRVELAAGYSEQTTYRSYLSEDDIERAARRHGRTVVRSFDVGGDVRTFLFARAVS